MSKERPNKDFLQTFIFDSCQIRGAVVQLEGSLATLFDQHNYTLSQKRILAESSAATVLMTSHLKFDGSLSLQAKGSGAIKLLTCECDNQLTYRGLLTADDFDGMNFSSLFQDTTLAITIEPEKGKRYQGIVPLDGASISTCLQHYFLQSEQLPTLFSFASDGNKVIGLMIQSLPGSASNTQEDWQRIKMLTDTLSTDEMLTLDHQTWLYRLYHEETIRLFETRPVSFCCSCSRERFERALISLGKETLDQMIAEDGKIETECQFCHSQYRFNENDIHALLLSGSKKTDH